jgi:thioredoxin
MSKSKESKNISKKRKAKVAKKNHRKESGPVEVRSQAQFEKILDDPKPVVVDFWAPWCGPCKMMAPTFERVAEKAGEDVHFVKVDTQKLPELAAAFGVRSIPTIVCLVGDEVVDSHVGLVAENGLEKMARRTLDKANGVTLGDKVKRMFGGAAGS